MALTPRTEKTLRLVAICALAAVFGILAVVMENEPLGWIAVGLLLAGILIGPLSARFFTRSPER